LKLIYNLCFPPIDKYSLIRNFSRGFGTQSIEFWFDRGLDTCDEKDMEKRGGG
jgi:hypothetical protein